MSYISEVDILDEARENFLVYANEVLTDRAIPSAEDGLLSAQRKLLWTMSEHLKMDSKGKTKKCNAVVGSTLATSYFHGDQACYGVLCKMSQDFLMRYPLVTGQGSLGTQESNDMVASSRYTEAKPSVYTDLMMIDFKKNAVPLKETYNGEYMEPVVLPSLFPNAICNGRQAIGVSMAVNTPSHNLTEVCNAILRYIENNNLTIDELLEIMPGPDFPLGGTILNTKDVRKAYETGKSTVSLKIRGDYEIRGREIIFTTIPYRTYRNKIKEQIEKNIETLSEVLDDYDDASSIGQNKLIFYVKKGIEPQIALESLFNLTDLQTTLSYNMNYIVNGTPKLCSMLDLIRAYLEHQHNVLTNITTYDKEKAEVRIHILKGLIKAVDKIDEVIQLIKTSESRGEAKEKLIDFLAIDDTQANAILDMKLGKLTRIDKQELVDELEKLVKMVEIYIEILESKEKRNSIIHDKVKDLRDKYGDDRRTKLLDITIEKKPSKKEQSVLPPEDCVVVVTGHHTVKRIPKKQFKTQKRATTGIKTSDITLYSAETNTDDTLMIFTSQGLMYRVPVKSIPEGTNTSTGVSIFSLIELNAGEKPMAYTTLTRDAINSFILFATKQGIIKKASIEEYDKMKKNGIKAIALKDNDELVNVTFMNQEEDIIICTKQGMIIRFTESDVPLSSRIAQGVKGIALKENDEVLAALPIHKSDTHIAIVDNTGHGKRIEISSLNRQKRAGKGLTCGNDIRAICAICEGDSLLINGDKTSIVIEDKDIPVMSRTATGNILIKNNTEITGCLRLTK